MSITSGFYNSRNHDRQYTNVQIGSIFDGIITDGVYASIGGKFMVREDSGMGVIVSPGRCWFDHTWILNDADYPMTIDSAEAVLDRVDAIVLETNHTVSIREGTIKIIKGSPGSIPKKPTMVHNEAVNQYPIAFITVKAESKMIIADVIENVVGTSECPFVTGVLSTVNTDELIAQWAAQFQTLFAKMEKAVSELQQGILPEGSVSTRFEAVANPANWQDMGDYFVQDIPIIGIKETDNKAIIDVDISGISGFEAQNVVLESWTLWRAIPGNDIIKLYFTGKPEVEIPFSVVCIRK